MRLLARPRAASVLAAALVLASSPADAQQRRGGWRDEAMWAGAGAAALVGAALLDRTVDGGVAQGGGTRLEWATDALNHGGRPQYAVAALGAVWAGGRLSGSRPTAKAAEHVLLALLASGVANGTLKYSIGRERPSTTDDPHRFVPFNADNRWQSFPSGHATVAFSLAASISEEAREPWVTGLTYGAAALVGWSRVYDDKHWTSDVVGGALIGIVTSRATVAWLHRHGRDGDGDGGDRDGGARVAILPNALIVSIPR